MITVLVVDDSPVVRRLLSAILQSDPEIEVIGEAENGKRALEFLKTQKPHVITMDIYMPEMDGLVATRLIMESSPTPVIVISASWQPIEVARTFEAIEAGALSLLEKPGGPGSSNSEELNAQLISAVKMAAKVKVRRLRGNTPPIKMREEKKIKKREISVIAIGASTGGPKAIRELFIHLPEDFSVPFLLVQHMAIGFTEGFVGWLQETTPFKAQLAAHNTFIQAGTIYVAPEGYQMKVKHGGLLALTCDPPENSIIPSASFLFRSVASVYKKRGVGILLTGMGVDGAYELKAIKDAGGITFAQDKFSSVIHGMPGEAIRLGASQYVLSPKGIALALRELVKEGEESYL